MIIKSRLETLTDHFSPQAIEYVARKVAAVSGDVRRALELCRRGAEIAAEGGGVYEGGVVGGDVGGGGEAAAVVTIRNIDQAIKEMFGASHLRLIEACSHLERIVLGFLMLELRASGVVETTLEHLCTRVDTSMTMAADAASGDARFKPTIAEIGRAVTNLGRMRLVIADAAWLHRQRKIAMNVPAEDVSHVICSMESLKWMHNMLKA